MSMAYDKSKVSIVIGCKNEGQGIKQIIQSVKKYSNDIIVVDGHSNDGTKEITKAEKARFYLDNKLGRGDALKIGIKVAKCKVIVFFDADGSHEASDIPALVKPIFNGKAELVMGSRRTGGSFDVNVNPTGIIRAAGCDFLVWLVNNRFHTNLTDILYSFRAIKTEVAKEINIQSNDFGVEQEMVVSCLRKKYRVSEIPSREKARGWGQSKLHTLTGLKFVASLIQDLYFK